MACSRCPRGTRAKADDTVTNPRTRIGLRAAGAGRAGWTSRAAIGGEWCVGWEIGRFGGKWGMKGVRGEGEEGGLCQKGFGQAGVGRAGVVARSTLRMQKERCFVLARRGVQQEMRSNEDW